jgi:cytochrome oxidase Cu insertion factor (SCO1/SenC/PrrC family)
MRLRLFGTLLLVAAVCGVGIGTTLALVGRGSTHAPAAAAALRAQATWPAGTRRAPGFRLRDEAGRLVSLSSQRGRVVLLTFLDSRCRLECPVEGRLLARVQQRLSGGSRARLLVVSVDPWADTPLSARAFAAESRWQGDWRWLLGTPVQLRPVWAEYAVAVRRTRRDVGHTAVLYLIDARGFQRAAYLVPFRPSDVVAGVQGLAGS